MRHTLSGGTRPSRASRPTPGLAARRRVAARPALEPLEDRNLLTTGGGPVSYHGGPLIPSVQVENVYYGQQWGSDPSLSPQAAQLNQFMTYTTSSSYIDLLSQYSVSGQTIGHGAFSGSDYVTGSTSPGSGSVVDDRNTPIGQPTSIRAMLGSEIAAGRVPYPNGNRLYFVYTSPNVEVTDPALGDSHHNFLGYHDNFLYNGTQVYYAVIPHPVGNVDIGFQNAPLFDPVSQQTGVSSHELAEAITDPTPSGPTTGWYSNTTGEEVADITNGQFVYLNDSVVQQVYSNATGGAASPNGSVSDVPVPADYDGVGHAEVAVFRPSTAQWYVGGHAQPIATYGATNLFDIPVPADYQGVGHAQLAVFRPSTAQWFVAGTGQPIATYGAPGLADIPVPADYDGVGHAEVAVFRPSTGQWFVGGHAQPIATLGGLNLSDIPAPADYDGVGHAEPAVFRPSTGQWFVDGPNGQYSFTYGGNNRIDVPTPAKYNGGITAQASTFRPATTEWWVGGYGQPYAVYGAGNTYTPPIVFYFPGGGSAPGGSGGGVGAFAVGGGHKPAPAASRPGAGSGTSGSHGVDGVIIADPGATTGSAAKPVAVTARAANPGRPVISIARTVVAQDTPRPSGLTAWGVE